MQIETQWLGLQNFSESLEIQAKTAQRVRSNGMGYILGLEHEPVITLGKRSNLEVDLRSSPDSLKEKGFTIEPVDRGGEAVLHSPGQLVIYPVLPLTILNLGVRDYVCALERSTIEMLSDLGITAKSGCKEPGVFTSVGKIAMIGIRVDRGVTRHGIAINVSNDLGLFSHIRCCGVQEQTMDRVVDYDLKDTRLPSINALQVHLFRKWTEIFLKSLKSLTSNLKID